MHEYAVTQNIVNIAVSEAETAGSKKIIEIRLVIGDLSSIIDESVSMYFDIISKGTAAEGAKLVFKRVPAGLVCTVCGIKFNKPQRGFECPVCGSQGTLTGEGKEFYIESLEVE
jgi:Zn finger protein HypA/HybF (possibly regulating hydrogenase expression)